MCVQTILFDAWKALSVSLVIKSHIFLDNWKSLPLWDLKNEGFLSLCYPFFLAILLLKKNFQPSNFVRKLNTRNVVMKWLLEYVIKLSHIDKCWNWVFTLVLGKGLEYGGFIIVTVKPLNSGFLGTWFLLLSIVRLVVSPLSDSV